MSVANSSNITTIQILRSYSNTTPLTLQDGQLAYSFVSNTLFIGSNTGVKIIGDPSTAVKSQAAYNQANTATVLANAAYFHANGAFIRANAAFDNSNTKVSKSGDTMTGSLQFFGPTFAIGQYDGVGGIDLYANNTTSHAQLNFANTNFSYVDAYEAALQTPNSQVLAYTSGNVEIFTSTDGSATRDTWTFDTTGTLTVPGPISGLGESKLDFTTYGPNTAYLTTINDDSTALFMGTGSAELYASTDVQIRANTKETSQNWTFGAGGTLTFPDNTIQTTAYTPGGEIDELARATANAAYFHANGAFLKANAAFDQANLTIGVDASQNVRLAFSNTRMDISDGVNASQNVRLAFSNTRMDISDGVNTTQNTRLTVIENTDLSQNVRLNFSNTRMDISDGVNASQNVRLDFSNTRMTIIDGVDASQNARMTIIEGTDVSQNARMTIIEGVNVTQNTDIANKLSLSGASYQTVSGNVAFLNDVSVSGNLIVLGNTISLNVTSLEVKDALIQLGIGNYNTDVLTIGYVGHYNDGTNAQAGMIRDAGTKEFYAFQGYTPGVTGNTVNINDASFAKANIQGNWFKGNLIATTARVGGLDIKDFATASFNQANTGTVLAQASFNQANATVGVDATQNTRLTVIEGTDVSQNVRLDYSNTAITIIQGVDVTQNTRLTVSEGVDLSQNVRLDFSNTRMTIIEGTDTSQNARMTIIEATDVSQNVRIDYSNTALTIVQGVDNSQNVRLDYSNTAITIIQGVDVGQNARMAIIEGTDVSQNVRLNFSNTRMDISDGVNASQNVRLDFSNTRMTIIEGVDVTQNTNIANAYTKANNALANTTGTFAGTLTVTGNVIANSFITSGSSGDISGANFVYANTFVSSNAYIFPDGSVQTTAASASLANGAYNQANTATVLAQAAYNQANVTIGVDASQNVRLDFSNTRMTIIEGVNVTQNTAIASTDGKMQSAYNQANTGTVLAQAAFNRANSTPNNYLANTFVVANSTGYLSNSNVFFVSANNTTVINGNLNVINTLVTSNIISTGSGVANISSITNLDLFSPTSVRIVGGGTLKLPNLSDAQKSTIVAANGDIIYNTTKNKVETYENGDWINSDRAVTNIANVWLANSIIFANTIGYLSNSSSLQYISSNNTIITGSIITTGISGDISNANNIFANTFIANGVNLYNFANAAFNVANTSSANTIIIQGVDTSQNVRLDYSNAAITIIQGTDTSQNARMTIIEGTDASQNVRLDYSNTALTIAQGVDNSQNVRLDFSNTAITIIQGTDVSQNARMTIIEGTDVSQNVRLDYSNTAITIIQGVDVTQNTRLTVTEGTDASQNVRLDFSNARMTIIEGVDVTQNTNIANKLSLTGAASQTVSGNVVFGNDVTVTGNLIVLGNTLSINVSSLEVEDTLIQLGIGNYTTDIFSIGYVGHYNDGTNAHAGFIRDSGTKEFYAFQGYTPETTANTININDASFRKANINSDWFKGNLIATTARVDGLDIKDFTTAAFNQANTADVRSTASYFHANGAFIKANAAFDQANVTIGVDASQNSRMTIIEGTDLSQNVRLDYSNTALTIAQGVDNSQNVRLDYSNTAITIIQGTDTTQNTRLTVIEGTDASQNVRLDFSNTRMTIIEGVDVEQNTRMTVIEGTDVGQNSRMTIIENTDLSQNVRLAFSNTRMDIIDGVNASQNVRLDYSNTALTIAQGVDNSQNVRIDFSNTRMTIIDGVDVSQNARMTIIEGTDVSQNVRLDYSNTAITIIQGVDTTQNSRMTIIEGTDTSQNVRLDFSNTRMTIIEGVDSGQNSRMTIIEGTDASQNVRLDYSNTAITQVDNKAQAAFDKANTGGGASAIDQIARDTANAGYFHANGAFIRANAAFDAANVVAGGLITSNASVVIIQGVDVGQNSRMTIIEGTDVSQNVRLNFSNTRMDISDGVDASQNVRLDYSNTAITIIQGVDVGQNTRLTVIEGTDASQNVRLDYSNAAITIIQGTDTTQNSRMTIIEGVDVGQNTRMTIADGVDASQNVRLDYSNTAITIIQGVNTTQNTNITIADNKAQAAFDKANTGGGTGTGNANTFGWLANTIIVANSTGYLSNSNSFFVASNNTIITGSIITTGISGDISNANNIFANTFIANGVNLYNFANAAFTVANTSSANTIIIQGVDVGQNSRMTIIEGVDVGQNSRMTIIEGTNASQNVRLDFSNTAIAATDGKMQLAYNTANNAVANLGPVITTNSVARVIIANTTISTGATSGALTVSGGVGITGNLYLQQASTFVDTILRVGAAAGAANLQIEGYGSNFKLSSCSATVLSTTGTTVDANIVGFQSTTLNVGSQFSTSNVQIYTGAAGGAASLKIYSLGSGPAYANIGSTPSVGSQVNIISSLPSTSNSSGALVLTGGVGVSGNLYVGGTNAGVNGIYTDVLRYAANGLPWVMGSGGGTSSLDQYARDTANNASSNTIIIQGVDVGQNSRMTIIEGVDTSQNVRIDYSNTAITQVDNKAQAAFDKANTGGGGGGGGTGTGNANTFGWLANTIIVANSTGYLSNSNSFFVASNNTIVLTGNLIANSVFVSGGVEIVTVVLANNVVTPSASVVLNDITNQFDNLKCVFNLRSEQSNVINIMNSRNLEVIVNGAKLAPYVGELRFPWLTPYDSFKGHRVVSSNTSSQVVIYNPPAPGDQAILTLINSSSASQNRRYPYSAATIALGD